MRHHISGWELDVSHEFSRRAPNLALRKRLRHATVSATYDVQDREAGVQFCCSGVVLGARLQRAEGQGGWKKPSLVMHIEPLSLLS